MEWVNKLKRIMGVPEDDFMPEEDTVETTETESKRTQFFENRKKEEHTFDPRETSRFESYKEPRRVRDEKFMNINATAQLQVILVKPESYSEASEIADHLKDRKTVLLNLENVAPAIVRRIVDFLSGVAYAQGGTLKRVANGTFIVTPYDVNIMGDVLDELKMDKAIF